MAPHNNTRDKRLAPLIIPSSWTRLLDLEKEFGRTAPLEADLGCGKGRFLHARASAFPEVNFLGVDRLLRRVRKTGSKIVRSSLSNVRLLRIDTRYAVAWLLPPSSVRVFYIFFPDPWPKRRHHGRRLFSPSFVKSLHEALEENGSVHVATDHMDYFKDIKRMFEDDGRFASLPEFLPGDEERSEFEIAVTEGHGPIGRCSYRKAS
ncbi:MAG: tRNA (guanosine(46)-N7)-methyltransferase TrmB [Kiritimatiellia bacterium]